MNQTLLGRYEVIVSSYKQQRIEMGNSKGLTKSSQNWNTTRFGEMRADTELGLFEHRLAIKSRYVESVDSVDACSSST